MQAYSRTRRAGERGTILLKVMIVVILLMGLSAAVTGLAQVNSTQSQLVFDETELYIAAESALSRAEKTINRAVANWDTPAGTLNYNIGEVAVTVNTQHVDTQDYTVTDSDGIVTSMQVWKMTADASKVISKDGDTFTKRVHRIILVAITPLFQFVAFYNNDLEINPGPDMLLTGRVHTNQDMYLTCDGNTLTFDSNYIRAVGNIYRARKDDFSKSNGTVMIKNAVTGNYVEMENQSDFNPPNGSVSGFDSNYDGYDANGDGDLTDSGDYLNWTLGALDKWEGTVKSGVHDTAVWESPEVGTTEPYVESAGGDYDADGNFVGAGMGTHKKGFYHENAGLTIVDDKAYDASGNDITALLPAGTIQEKTMFDGREEKTITVTEIDMKLLSESPYFPSNGLIYSNRTDMTKQEDAGGSYQPNGIRMTNGEQLAGPMTMVSNAPVYVHGDFNTGLDAGDMDPGYTGNLGKQPASVITDSINLLSNSWDDSKTNGNLPDATDTTFNCAFVTGNHDTNFSADGSNRHYNGGFENLPRFHEDWGGKTATIRGSFVNLWNSSVGVGDWVYGDDNYKAPNRDWDFDNDFFDANNLPPFTPRAVGTARSIQWEE